jgi:hypothetical protein
MGSHLSGDSSSLGVLFLCCSILASVAIVCSSALFSARHACLPDHGALTVSQTSVKTSTETPTRGGTARPSLICSPSPQSSTARSSACTAASPLTSHRLTRCTNIYIYIYAFIELHAMACASEHDDFVFKSDCGCKRCPPCPHSRSSLLLTYHHRFA